MSRCFIVATGHSLKGIDLSGLRDQPVIAINKSFELVPFAQWLYFYDRRFLRWYGDQIKGFQGQLVSCAKNLGDHVEYRPKAKKLKERKAGELVGPDSGTHAILLAVDLGFTRIVLLGYDMKFHHVDGKVESHWFGDYPLKSREHNYSQRSLPFYPELETYLSEQGIEVVNANPDSALQVFPFVRLEDELNTSGTHQTK